MTFLRVMREREGRSTRDVKAFVHRQDGREIEVAISNISNAGCRIRSAAGLAAGERIRIEVPRLGSLCGEVRWSQEGEAGVLFEPQTDVWEETRSLQH